MIARIWHGWTTPANAATYESLLKDEIFVGIQDRRIPGFKSIHYCVGKLAVKLNSSRLCFSIRGRRFVSLPERTTH
jgi:hypothetical protein